ncbi:BRO family protein [Neisseria sp. Ec49-e6-T10]|uniref:BRO family protein n=1 Tax=Neisseria sp. Ec49-e6-T10 TaxID=3140744 RepID=UPI003EBE444C
MSNISTFNFNNEIPVRAINKDGEIWFVATDICKALGISNPSKALNVLEENERSNFKLGRQGNANIINESGMYTLVLRSNDAIKTGTPANIFKKWVTSEVLPSIRKTGSYSHTINTEQQYQIKEAVMQLASKTGKKHQAIYRDLYNEFKIPKYQDLLVKDYDRALQFLEFSIKQLPSKNTLLIPFNLVRDADYRVFVRNGKARKMSVMYAEDARDIGKPWGSES